MRHLETLNVNLEHLRQVLDSAEMDPDPNRTDFIQHAESLSETENRIESGVLDVLDEALLELRDDEERAKAKSAVAAMTAEVACLLFAAKRQGKVSTLFARARSVDPAGPRSALLSEIERDYTVMVKLNRAEWLFAQKRRVECEHLARELVALRGFPETAKLAKTYLDAPTPIKRAPTMYTLNGVGTKLWGKRDARPDGTYIATLCFVVLFLPIFAISAYRVRYAGDNTYTFFNKVPLSAFARWWRRLLVSAILALAVSSFVQGWRNSPERRLARDMKDAVVMELAAQTEADKQQVLRTYNDIIRDFGGEYPEAGEAARGVLRIETAKVPSPLKLQDADPAHRVFARYAALPELMKAAAAEPMAQSLMQWAKEISGEKPTQVFRERIKLASRVLEIPAQKYHREAARIKIDATMAWAKRLAPARPLDAVHRYLSASESPEAVRAAAAVFRTLKEMPALHADLSHDADLFAAAVSANNLNELTPEAAALTQAVTAATEAEATPERLALLQSDTEKPLKDALKKSPRDQSIAAALASMKRIAGKPAEGAALLESAKGDGGFFSRSAELTYIDCLSDLGRLDEAAERLEQILDARLPDYLDVSEKLTRAAEAMENRLVADANAGRLPPAIQGRLNTASNEEQQGIFSKWLNEQMMSDNTIAALRASYLDMWDVVPAALRLGAVNLTRAGDAAEPQKSALLKAAEDAYLSVRSDAEDDPQYHIGLGQVYYRLGKTAEGDAEFSRILAQKDPQLTLSVLYVYRELGLSDRAFTTARSLYETAESPIKESAALAASLSAPTRDERETWLQKGDKKSIQVIAGLLEIEGDKALEQGDIKGADAKYKEAERLYTKEGKTSDAGLNNAALAARKRYEITGELSHIDRAAALLEKTVAHMPDSAIVLENLALTLKYRGTLKVLENYYRTALLKATDDEAENLLSYLLEGSKRDEVLRRLKQSADMGRALALVKQAEVLSPKMAAAYHTELEIARALDDTELLKALKTRIEAQNGAVSLDKTAYRRDWLSGKYDDRTRTSLETAIPHIERDLETVRKLKDPATLAALLIKLGWAHSIMSYLKDPQAELTAAYAALEEAHKVWPDSGAAYGVTAVLSAQTLLGAAGANKTVADLVSAKRRLLSDTAIMARALEQDPSGAAAALKARPELSDLSSLLEKDERPGALTVVAAKISGNPVLAAMVPKAKSRETEKLALQISGLLDAGDEDVQIKMGLLAAN